MRRFELILAFVAVFAVAWPAVFGVRPRRGIASLALVAALIAQLRLEGFRWQLIPLYVVAIALAVGDVIFVERSLGWTNRIARGVFGVAGVGLATTLAIVLPVPRLPVPPGPDQIGTISVQVVDQERIEEYGPLHGGARKFVAQVWYPAAADASAEPVLWSEDWDVVAPALSQEMGLPSWFLNQTQYTRSHAGESLPPQAGNFPIVIFSHGWTEFRSIVINQIEALVSSGYIVIAPDHTYGAVSTRLGEDEVVAYDPSALPNPADVTDKQYSEAAAQLVATFAGDIVTIMNELELGEDGRFASIVANADLTRIGVYGHETGGGAAIEVCLEDQRCDAVLALDPWVEALPDEVIKVSASKPSLYMRSDDWRGTENDAILRGISGRSEAVTYWVGVDGAHENDFVAAPLLSPLASDFGLTGPIPAGRVIPIIDNYLLGFFDVYLLGTGPAALDAVTFEEVTVEVINP